MEKCKGIILEKRPYKEVDELCWIYTKEHGHLSAIIRGSKRKNNRYSGELPLFATVYLDINIRKGLSIIYQFEVIQSFYKENDELLKLFLYGLQINECVKKSIPQQEGIPGLFELIEALYRFILTNDTPAIATSYLQQELSSYQGIKFSFEACSRCGSREHIVAFSYRNGGLVCRNCYEEEPHAIFDRQTIQLLIAFSRLDIKKLSKIELDQTQAKVIVDFWKDIYLTNLGIKLNSQSL